MDHFIHEHNLNTGGSKGFIKRKAATQSRINKEPKKNK